MTSNTVFDNGRLHHDTYLDFLKSAFQPQAHTIEKTGDLIITMGSMFFGPLPDTKIENGKIKLEDNEVVAEVIINQDRKTLKGLVHLVAPGKRVTLFEMEIMYTEGSTAPFMMQSVRMPTHGTAQG